MAADVFAGAGLADAAFVRARAEVARLGAGGLAAAGFTAGVAGAAVLAVLRAVRVPDAAARVLLGAARTGAAAGVVSADGGAAA